jgi:AraC family transcriptional regulator
LNVLLDVPGSVTPLLESPLLTVGEFRCPPGDTAWRETNLIGDRPHVVFPRIPVLIQHLGEAAVLATANSTMLYNADQRYLRRLRNRSGDNCVYIELLHESLAMLAEEGAGLIDSSYQLVASHAPTDRRTYLLQHLLVRHLKGPNPDPLLAEETASILVLSALRGRPASAPRRRGSTEATHRELAEAAKTELASAPGASLTLSELARGLHSSAFHLARVFRMETGFSLHGFRQTLRLRAALERLSSHAGDLGMLALELGFSSHSHFSERFRNEFGVSPSQVVNERQVRTLLEVAGRG